MCFEFEGERFDASKAEDIVARLRPRDPKPDVSITATTEAPYRCIGAIVYTLQRAGYAKIGFIAEPPADAR